MAMAVTVTEVDHADDTEHGRARGRFDDVRLLTAKPMEVSRKAGEAERRRKPRRSTHSRSRRRGPWRRLEGSPFDSLYQVKEGDEAHLPVPSEQREVVWNGGGEQQQWRRSRWFHRRKGRRNTKTMQEDEEITKG